LDRFDLIIEVPRQNIDKILSKSENETSNQIKEKIKKAVKIQKERFENEDIDFNSQMTPKMIEKYCVLSEQVQNILKIASEKLSLSARSLHRIIKLSRTLADLN
jgi:magnesium chelatase family protein